MRNNAPLVSIMIPNYNYSRYLDECLRSAVAQTYRPLEIILLDNQSTDSSMEIAAKYAADGVRVCRNCTNIRSVSYRFLANSLSSGEFMLLLCSDDAIEPTFVEKAVAVMRRYPNVGYVHGERDFVHEGCSSTILEPFFNCSFVVPGESVMPLYMVTTIGHPSQGIFRRSAFNRIGGYVKEIDHANADKTLWFYLSTVSDYGYIREKMCRIRVAHAGSQVQLGIGNFQHPLLCHMMINDFLRFAGQYGHPAVLARRDDAFAVLANEFLGFAGSLLDTGDYDSAKRYLLYARVLRRDMEDNERWRKLSAMHESKSPDHEYIAQYNGTMFAAKKRNYQPPERYEEINTEALCDDKY